MTGSNAVLIAVPIVALVTLAFWLGLVYYVGAHPEWKVHRLQREAREREAQARAAGRRRGRGPGRHAGHGPGGRGSRAGPGGAGQTGRDPGRGPAVSYLVLTENPFPSIQMTDPELSGGSRAA